VTDTGADGAVPRPRRSIFRDDAPDAAPRDPWAVPAPGAGAAADGSTRPDRPSHPSVDGRDSIFRVEADPHDGTHR